MCILIFSVMQARFLEHWFTKREIQNCTSARLGAPHQTAARTVTRLCQFGGNIISAAFARGKLVTVTVNSILHLANSSDTCFA